MRESNDEKLHIGDCHLENLLTKYYFHDYFSFFKAIEYVSSLDSESPRQRFVEEEIGHMCCKWHGKPVRVVHSTSWSTGSTAANKAGSSRQSRGTNREPKAVEQKRQEKAIGVALRQGTVLIHGAPAIKVSSY